MNVAPMVAPALASRPPAVTAEADDAIPVDGAFLVLRVRLASLNGSRDSRLCTVPGRSGRQLVLVQHHRCHIRAKYQSSPETSPRPVLVPIYLSHLISVLEGDTHNWKYGSDAVLCSVCSGGRCDTQGSYSVRRCLPRVRSEACVDLSLCFHWLAHLTACLPPFGNPPATTHTHFF